AFIFLAIRYLFHLDGWSGIFSTVPFYDPKTFNFKVLRGAVPLAALTYIGFDGVTTLAEDVENPKRNVLLATVLVCLFTGVFGGGVLLTMGGHGYENAAELLNFGAFVAFMGVNFATFWQFGVRRSTGLRVRVMADVILPLFGFAFCGWIWLNLNITAKVVGGIWFVIGIM